MWSHRHIIWKKNDTAALGMFMPVIKSSLHIHPSPLVVLLLLFENNSAIKVTKGWVVLLREVIIAIKSRR